jgi:YVTN family beta-propeller protein
LPCLAWAQYPSNGNQKITLGEQTTADGLIYRGVAADTTLTAKSDTAAYFVLDTVNKKLYFFKASATPKWNEISGSGGGNGVDSTAIAYVNTYGTQTVNGVKTFNNRLISTNAMHFVDTALSIVSFAKKTVQPNGIVGAGSGVLSTKTDYTTGTQPLSVNVDPTGRFVYVANYGSNTVSMYVINQTNGTLSAKTDYTTGANPFTLNVDPTGRFVYVLNYESSTVSMYVINQTNGTLSAKTDYTTGTNPFSVNVDPTGRFVYVANISSNTVSQYFLQSFSAGGAYIAGRLSIGVDSAQTNYSVNIGTTFKQDSLFVGGRVTAVGYTTRSDVDAKENITPLKYGIKEVMELEPVIYNYLNEEGKSLGFIAQDIGLIIPEAISWETPFSVYYQYLIPILTKAIQEQQALIKSLQKRLLILENK